MLKFFLLFLLWLPCALAVDASSMPYQGEVAVASYTPDDWQKAVAPALLQVLVKVSGNPNVAQLPSIKPALAKANLYVQSYNYLSADETKKLMLQVRFSPQKVNALLKTASQPILSNSNQNQSNSADDPAQAVSGDDVATLTVKVTGINGLNDYSGLINYLHGLNKRITVDVLQTQDSDLIIKIKAKDNAANLLQTLTQNNKLTVQSTEENAMPVLHWHGATVPVTTPNAPVLVAPPRAPDNSSPAPDSNGAAQSFGVDLPAGFNEEKTQPQTPVEVTP